MNAPNDAMFLREGPLNKVTNWVALSGIWTRVLWNARQARTITARWFNMKLNGWFHLTEGQPGEWVVVLDLKTRQVSKYVLQQDCWRASWRETWKAWIALVLLSSFCVSSFLRNSHDFSSEYGRSNFSSINQVSEHIPTNNSIDVGLTRGIGQASESVVAESRKKHLIMRGERNMRTTRPVPLWVPRHYCA